MNKYHIFIDESNISGAQIGILGVEDECNEEYKDVIGPIYVGSYYAENEELAIKECAKVEELPERVLTVLCL